VCPIIAREVGVASGPTGASQLAAVDATAPAFVAPSLTHTTCMFY